MGQYNVYNLVVHPHAFFYDFIDNLVRREKSSSASSLVDTTTRAVPQVPDKRLVLASVNVSLNVDEVAHLKRDFCC